MRSQLEEDTSNRMFETAKHLRSIVPASVYKVYLRIITGLLQCVVLPGESKKMETEVTFPDKDQVVKFISNEEALESGMW